MVDPSPRPRENNNNLTQFFFGGGGARTRTTHTRGGTQRTDIEPPALPMHLKTKTMRVTSTRQTNFLEEGTGGWGRAKSNSPCTRSKEEAERVVDPSPRPRENNNNLTQCFFGGGGARRTTTHTRGGTQRTDIAPTARPKHQMTKAVRVTGARQITGLEVGTARA